MALIPPTIMPEKNLSPIIKLSRNELKINNYAPSESSDDDKVKDQNKTNPYQLNIVNKNNNIEIKEM